MVTSGGALFGWMGTMMLTGTLWILLIVGVLAAIIWVLSQPQMEQLTSPTHPSDSRLGVGDERLTSYDAGVSGYQQSRCVSEE